MCVEVAMGRRSCALLLLLSLSSPSPCFSFGEFSALDKLPEEVGSAKKTGLATEEATEESEDGKGDDSDDEDDDCETAQQKADLKAEAKKLLKALADPCPYANDGICDVPAPVAPVAPVFDDPFDDPPPPPSDGSNGIQWYLHHSSGGSGSRRALQGDHVCKEGTDCFDCDGTPQECPEHNTRAIMGKNGSGGCTNWAAWGGLGFVFVLATILCRFCKRRCQGLEKRLPQSTLRGQPMCCAA